METIKETTLYFRQGTSDKVYILYLQKQEKTNTETFIRGELYRVVAIYGKRTSTKKEAIKGQDLSLLQAQALYEKVLKSKTQRKRQPYKIAA